MARIETVKTACTRDCPDACGLIATVEDGRVTRLSGDPDHPITRGFLCYRTGSRYLDRHYSADRLRAPLARRGGRFVAISWDEALDLAAAKLRAIRTESGAAALLHVQGGGSLGLSKKLNALFFRHYGGATETRGELCDGAGPAANELDFGRPDMNDPAELLQAQGIILWGKNVASSSPHLVPFIKDARLRGAEVLLIDPIPHKSQSLADRFLMPRPGGDAALALGAARAALDAGAVDPAIRERSENLDAFQALAKSRTVAEWSAEAGLPAAALEDLARFLARRAPVTALLGWGLQRRGNGATQVRAIDALMALTGNLGRHGAGASFTVVRAAPFDVSAVQETDALVPRRLLLPLLGQEILAAQDPPIRAVIIDNANPVASCPDSATVQHALESREFVVVLDAFLTDSAAAAHLVLPTTLMLEEQDLVGSYGHHYVAASRPVVERLPGTRTDLEIYQALAARLGFGDRLAGTAEEWLERLATRLAAGGVTRPALDAAARRSPGGASVAYADLRFDTPSGKLRFLEQYRGPPAPDADYPLSLLAISSGRWQGSQLTPADEEIEGPLVATVHPESAAGLADGARARLASRTGALEVVVRHDPRFQRNLVHLPRARSFARGRCANALIEARLTDAGEGAAFYDTWARLEPLP